ncbi:MAG: hypothetical protein QG673_978 [Pseudomonadota bacterium]|nr:hypothetical protein [Pseudomonadota bacterium]
MSVKLTSTEIDKQYYLKLHSENKQIKLHVPNLYLWVTKKGQCTFRFKLYMNGCFSWVTLGKHPAMTVSNAVVKSYEMQSKRDAGINPNNEKRKLSAKNILLSAFIDDYVKINNKINIYADSTRQYSQYVFNIIVERLGSYKLQDITTSLIYAKLIKNYIDAGKLAMANRFRIKLKQIFDVAVKRELLIKNPVENLDNYHHPKDSYERNLHLTEIELQQFINELYRADIPNTTKYYIHLIIILGVRKSELYHATWDMIDFDNKVFNNYQIKTKKINKLPLSQQAFRILNQLKSISTSNYIVTNVKSIGKNQPVSHSYFNKVLDMLEFNKLRERQDRISPHDFRRVLSTLANESEQFAPIDIEMALGHETRSGVERHYNNNTAYLNCKRAVLEWMANKIDALIDQDMDVYSLLII